MKKIIFLLLIVLTLAVVSCVKQERVIQSPELPSYMVFSELEEKYTFGDYREYGVWTVYFERCELNGKIRDGRYFLNINGIAYPVSINPVNDRILEAFLPEHMTREIIRTAVLSVEKLKESAMRSEADLFIEKLYIKKEACNGTNLYELLLVDYISLKNAGSAYLYQQSHLIRPEYIKTNEENTYSLKHYYDARQLAAGHKMKEALSFLKAHPTHEQLLFFDYPNRVNINDLANPEVPDTRKRLRQLGAMGQITKDGSYTYDVKVAEDQIIVQLKRNTLKTEAYRQSSVFKLQLREDATLCCFVDSGNEIFISQIPLETTGNVELVKNARFIGIDPSKCSDIRIREDSLAYARLLTEVATSLRVASNTTTDQFKTYLEAMDGSAQKYHFENANGPLGGDDLLTNPSTLTVESEKGGEFTSSFGIVLMQNPYVKLEQMLSGNYEMSWHETIHGAIDAGVDSTVVPTITVYMGEYREVLDLGEKNYHITGSDPENEQVRDRTIINGDGLDNPVFMICGNQDNRTIIEGLAITAGIDIEQLKTGEIEPYTPGIMADGGNPEIRYNRIYRCGFEAGGGIISVSCDEPVEDIIIHHNVIEENGALFGGGVYLEDSKAQIYENVIRNNYAIYSGGGIHSYAYYVKNKAGDKWLAHVLPGTAESAREMERTALTNTFSGNMIGDSEGTGSGTSIAQDVYFFQSRSPSEDNITFHYQEDFVSVRKHMEEGTILRLFSHPASLTELASVVYETGMGAQIIMPYAIEPDTEYFVTLQGPDIYFYAQSEKVGKVSGCGPDIPRLDTPYKGQSNVQTALTLDWSDAYRALRYNLYFGTQSGNLNCIASGLTTSEYATEGLEEGKNYYWQVEAVDTHDATSVSEESYFTTIETPKLISPENHSNLSPNAVTLEWEAIEGVNYYNVYLGESTDTMNTVSSYHATTTYTPSIKPNRRYYWQVESKGNNGLSAKSEVNTFSVESGFKDGNGLKDDPFLVSCADELNNIRYYLGDDELTWFVQSADIDLTGWDWNPIGTYGGDGFKDFYDGKYNGIQHKIINLRIDKTENAVALFGYTQSGTITNCHVENAAVRGKQFVGILIGRNSYTVVENCFSSGEATGTGQVGGIVGINSYGTIINCHSSVNAYISQGTGCGSLIGANVCGSVELSQADGNAVGSVENNCCQVGGFIGSNDDCGKISQCYSTGNATGSMDIGGFVGSNRGKIVDCYNTGDSWSTGSYSKPGGFAGSCVGSNNLIKNCYNLGIPHGANAGDGIVSGSSNDIKIENCYWDFELTGVYGSPYGVYKGKQKWSALMKYRPTYESWDFDTVWAMETEDGFISYPYLRQNNDGTIPGRDKICAVGNGSEGNPYQITNAQELSNLNKRLGIEGVFFVQQNDIDLSGVENWEPVGGYGRAHFKGFFNGQGYKIQNLKISRSEESSVGLFGWLDAGTLTNITLENCSVSGRQYIGAVVGYNAGYLENISSSGDISGSSSVGGLVGCSAGTITSCDSHGMAFSTGGTVGGLVGTNFHFIEKSFSTASASGTSSCVGGFVGWNSSAEISECYSLGDATTTKSSVGGFVGSNWDSIISDCYSTGNVAAVKGGTNYFDGTSAGGFAGTNYSGSRIIRCYSSGKASGVREVGGFVGENSRCSGEPGIATDCFWNSTTSGTTDSCGGEPKTTSEMKDQTTFATWDFEGETINGTDEIWKSDAGTSYPYLRNLVPAILPMISGN